MRKKNKNTFNQVALKWAGILFLVGSVIIFLTDLLLEQFLSDYPSYRTYQTLKGIGFCSLVSIVFFFTIRQLLQKVNDEQRRIKREKGFSERIQNSIPGIFFVLDKQGNLIRWNDNTNTISGLSNEELNKLYGIKRVEEKDREKARKALNKALEKGHNEAELSIKTTFEEESIYKITASRFENEDEIFIVGTGINITKEKKLEKEISRLLKKEREARKKIEIDIKNLKTTLDQTPSPRCILEGPEHVYTYANKAYKNVVGDDDLIGKKVIDVIPEVGEQGYIEILDKVYHTGESYIANNQPVSLNKKDDERQDYIFNLLYEPLQDENGEVYGIYAEGIDISEQVKSNEKLKRQNYQLKVAQEIAQLGYWETDLTNNNLIWSDIVYDLFGLDKDSFNPTTKKFLDLIHPDDRDILKRNIEQLKQEGVFESQYRLIKPNGEIGWFREIGEVYEWQDDDPKILHGIVLDITEQKNHEKRIKKSHIQGENKERKRISNELHDGIAQYLSAALLHIDNTRDHLDANGGLPELRHARELVKRAVTETRTISQNLIPQTIEKNGLIPAIRSLIKQYQLSTNIKFLFNQEIQDPSAFDSEIETNLYRIVQELLSNAVRHSGCDKIWITLGATDGQLYCSIEDNGRGSNFDSISSADGQGLQSVKNRIELLTGSIVFNNKPGKGLVINITIPRK